MNMFIHELKACRKSTIIWTCSLAALIIFFLSLYPTFSKDAADFRKLLDGYPEAVLKALGMDGDIFSLLGFYSFAFMYIILCGSVQAMNLGTSIVSKEATEKTADFLLTKPVKRSQVITSKLLALLVSLGITDVVYLIVSGIMINLVSNDSFSMKIFIMISVTLFFIQLIFAAIGVLISSIASKIKSVLSVSLGTVFGLFIINMFESVIGEEKLRYMTPFKYYDVEYIIKNGAYEIRFIILEIVLVIIAITASYLVYSKKDIHAV